MDLGSSFGRWLRARRRALDLTQADLARQVGCSVVTIQKIEADERRPSRQIAERLAGCLKIAADDRAAIITLARAEPYLDPAPAAAPEPSLRASQRLPGNLPAPLTRLIGRKQDVAAVRNTLVRGETRLLTLVGPPGIGKTRLSIAIAHDVQAAFADGAYFVALAPIRDPALVLVAITQMLDIRERAGQSLLDQLKIALREKQLLLVLDNFEQVLDAASLVVELLEACPGLKVLVTSRAALHVRGERLYSVPPLLLPDLNHLPATVTLARTPTLALFVERAQATLPEFRLTEQNAPAVAAICARLDGLPLAIELAATRIKLLSPEALLERLEQRLTLLTDGARDLPPRHRTLRTAITWSYDLLDAGEQMLFRRLSVFVGGCTIEAAEAVCLADGDLPIAVMDGLAALVGKSLLQRTAGPDGEPRFTMLETIREYALEQLEENCEAETIRQRHCVYYVAFAEHTEPDLIGLRQGISLDRLEADHDNMRAVFAWSDAGGDRDCALRLANALWSFWRMRGYASEGMAWFQSVLAQSYAAATVMHAQALVRAGDLASRQGDLTQSMTWCEEGLSLCRRLDHTGGVATALRILGRIAFTQRDFPLAFHRFDESLRLFRALDDTDNVATALNALGHVALAQGDDRSAAASFQEQLALARTLASQEGVLWACLGLGSVALHRHDIQQAHAYYTECLAMARELRQKPALGIALNALGEIARGQGDDQVAFAFYEESLVVRRELQDRSGIAAVLHNLGHVAYHLDDLERATLRFTESLKLYQEAGDRWGVGACISGLAAIWKVRGQAKHAARLLGAIEALQERLGARLAAIDRNEFDENVSALRAKLDEAVFSSAWEEGRRMSLEQAIAEALGEHTGLARI